VRWFVAESLKRRLIAGGSWVFAGKIVTAGSNVVVSSLLAQLLSTEGFGAYGLAFSLITAGALVSQLGLHQSVVRLVAEALGRGLEGRARSAVLFTYRYVTVGIVAVALFLLAGGGRWIARDLWGSPVLAAAMPAVAAWLAVNSLQVVTSETFRGFKDLKLASLFGGVITGAILVVALLAWIAVRGTATVEQAVWIGFGAGAISLGIALVVLRRRLARLPAGHRIAPGEVFSISLPLWTSSVTAFLLAQAPLWVIGAYLDEGEVALYVAALRLVTLVSMPLILVNLVVPPFIAELYSMGERLRLQRVLRSAATLAGLPAFAVLAAFVTLGEPIMNLIYSEPYGEGAPILALLSVGYLVNVWTGSCGVTLSMTGNQRSLMAITVTAAGLSVAGAVAVAPRYGTTGVAAVVCATAIFQNVGMWLAARYLTGMWTHAAIPSRKDVRDLLSRGTPAPPGQG
jgi:O-antigen/teichoic acid export membrane protein